MSPSPSLALWVLPGCYPPLRGDEGVGDGADEGVLGMAISASLAVLSIRTSGAAVSVVVAMACYGVKLRGRITLHAAEYGRRHVRPAIHQTVG